MSLPSSPVSRSLPASPRSESNPAPPIPRQTPRRLALAILCRCYESESRRRVDGPGRAGEERADREGEQLEADRVDAHRGGGDLVLADRHPGAADPAGVEPGEREDDEEEQYELDGVVVGEAG